MKTKTAVFSTGLAMFSMFFGSGNLVFPLLVGQLSQGHTILSSAGILLTGVFVPFLGILAMLLFDGDTGKLFSRLGGKPATFWFSLFALAIMGPFGVLARCITVAHGSYTLLFPATPLWVFSLCACLLLFFLTIRKNRIVPMLGSILTPLLLLSLTAIAIFGLISMPTPPVTESSGWEGFKIGIFQGYQTMDLLAAFFFSTFVINHLGQNKDAETTLSTFFKSSLIGAGLLSLVYIVLVLLGAHYASHLQGIPSQEMLGRIAHYALGPYAAPIVCSAVILACVTTAIVLTSLFSDFLRKEVAKEKIPPSLAILTTLTIGFFISTLEFSGIMKFIGPILEVIYPALIVMTLFSIAYKTLGWKAVRVPTAVALALKLLTAAI